MATRNRKSTNLFTRLLSKYKVNESTDCWEWQCGKNNIGYGMIRDDKKMRTAHRVSYELHNNTIIPVDMCVCHTCDNPTCINPDHLWLGTRHQNMADMRQKGRGNRITRAGTKSPRTVCPHCNKDVATNILVRWHGDKCKHKIQE